MGQFIYTAQGDQPDDPNLDAKTAMADPYSRSNHALRRTFSLFPS